LKKTGLLFGSFNPVHTGHLIIAEYFATQTEMDEVWFVVSPHNPLKEIALLEAEHHRLAMVKLAVKDNPHLHACEIEFTMRKPSYTIDTLHVLKDSFPKNEFILLMGEDNLPALHQWKSYQEILSSYEIYVYPRLNTTGTSLSPIQWEKHRIKFFPAPRLEISATRLREIISQDKSTRYLLHDDVVKYINTHQLYRS